MSRSLFGAGVEASTVIDDRQPQPFAAVFDVDHDLGGLGVAGHVAHGLAGQLDELQRLVGIERHVGIAGELDLDERAALELVGQGGQAGEQIDRRDHRAAQAEPLLERRHGHRSAVSGFILGFALPGAGIAAAGASCGSTGNVVVSGP